MPFPAEEVSGSGTSGGYSPTPSPSPTPSAPSPVTISNASGDRNRTKTRGTGGETGGLVSTIFDDSKEFTSLPIRFGYLYKTTPQILQSAVFTQLLGFGFEVDSGITPVGPSGLLTFSQLPVTAWVQVYGWVQFATNATGIRYIRLMNQATGVQLPAGALGMPAFSGGQVLLAATSLPIAVATLNAGVRLEAYQTSGAALNVEVAALWAKRMS